LIQKPHPVLAVPTIALVDAVLMGFGNRVYEVATGTYSVFAWPDSFWLLFWYTFVFATIAGAILAPIFYFGAKKKPPIPLPALLLAGALLGPIPIALLDKQLPNVMAVAVFSTLGMVSGAIWWLMVETPRVRHRATQ
jgi:hypothetical protein